MSAALELQFLSIEVYLAGEEIAEIRHEYLGGMVYAMAGTSDAHNTICLNLAAALRLHLRGGPCRVFMENVKARLSISRRDVFYYPDVMVTCDPRDSDPYFKRFPKLIIEVLSESTQSTDRREKLWNYTESASLEEYVLVAQDKMEVTLFRCANDWTPEILRDPDQKLELASLRFSLPLGGIHEGVKPV
jgi:Uma2 family endonuclease